MPRNKNTHDLLDNLAFIYKVRLRLTAVFQNAVISETLNRYPSSRNVDSLDENWCNRKKLRTKTKRN